MAEKKSKPTTKASEQGVMASLPSTRPARVGGRRRSTAANPAAPAGPAATSKPAAAKRKPTPVKPKVAAPKPKAAAPKPKAAAAKPAGATPAGRPALKPVATPPRAKRPRPVREGSPGLKTAATAAEQERPAPPTPPASSSPSGPEIVSTAIQAAGELAQIGLTVGGQLLKRAVERLPRP